VATQYIFNLHWYLDSGPNLPANQIQDVPSGGWGNWTLGHNIDWMQEKIALGDKFVLIGNIYALRSQANNAGTGKNACTIGVEILMLIHAGYVARAPKMENPDEQGVHAVRVFDLWKVFRRSNYLTFCTETRTKNTRLFAPEGFWTEELKDIYLNALD
jgi:hypothetical protein